MERALRFCGYLGCTLIGFGIIGALILKSFTQHPLIVGHLVLGVILLVAWTVTSGVQNLNKAGSMLTGRTARFGYHAVVYGAVFIGLVVVANIFTSLNDKRWDLTEEGVYSLSDKSQKILAGLTAPLKLIAVDIPEIQNKRATKELLDLYQYNGKGKVTTELVDPRTKPLLMDQLGMKQGNLLYIEYGEGASKAVSRVNELNEAAVTNAIVKLTRGAAKKVYFVQGHGEPNIEAAGPGGMKEFVDALADEHINTEGLLLIQTGSVPTDAAAVIIVAPDSEISQSEIDALAKYADDGGRLFLLGDAELASVKGISKLAAHFGITLGNDVVIDEQLRLFAGPQLAVQFTPQWFGPHVTTSQLSKLQPPVFTFAQSVAKSATPVTGAVYSELLKSGPNSWAESNINAILSAETPTASKDADDAQGPIVLGMAYEKPIGEAPKQGEDAVQKVSRVVVFGDATCLENGNLAVMANRDLGLNLVNWAAGEDGGIAIGPKNIRTSIAPIQQSTYSAILAFSFIGPEILLIVGLYIWWRRHSVYA